MSKYDYNYNGLENYCYPGTDVLINKLNIRDDIQLSKAERDITKPAWRVMRNIVVCYPSLFTPHSSLLIVTCPLVFFFLLFSLFFCFTSSLSLAFFLFSFFFIVFGFLGKFGKFGQI
jgi:hypothetical protein